MRRQEVARLYRENIQPYNRWSSTTIFPLVSSSSLSLLFLVHLVMCLRYGSRFGRTSGAVLAIHLESRTRRSSAGRLQPPMDPHPIVVEGGRIDDHPLTTCSLERSHRTLNDIGRRHGVKFWPIWIDIRGFLGSHAVPLFHSCCIFYSTRHSGERARQKYNEFTLSCSSQDEVQVLSKRRQCFSRR